MVIFNRKEELWVPWEDCLQYQLFSPSFSCFLAVFSLNLRHDTSCTEQKQQN